MDKVLKAKSELRARKWADIIKECQSSGRTVVSWCSENGIHIKSYYYWLRKLRLRALEQRSCQCSKIADPPVLFNKIEVQVPPNVSSPAVILRINGVSLEIPDGVSRQTIEAVLCALKSVC